MKRRSSYEKLRERRRRREKNVEEQKQSEAGVGFGAGDDDYGGGGTRRRGAFWVLATATEFADGEVAAWALGSLGSYISEVF